MKRLFFALLFLAAASASAQVTDTCRVFMRLVTYTGAPAPYTTITVKKLVKGGVNVVIPPRDGNPQSDVNGIVQFRALRASTIWLYAPLPGLDSAQITGRPVAIPDQDTCWLVQNAATATVPARYVVAMLDLRAGAAGNLFGTDSLIFAGAGVSLARSHGSLTVNISGGGGSAAVYGDSIRVADSLARLARDIANGKRDADSTNMRDQQQSDSLKALRDIVAGKGDSDSLSTAHGNAAQALADASTAMTRARIDSVYVGGTLDASDAAQQHPDVVILEVDQASVALADVAQYEDGTRMMVVNASGGTVWIQYGGSADDPDGGGGVDTVATWQTIVESGDAWRVIRPGSGSGSAYDTTLTSAMLDVGAVRPTTFANEKMLNTNRHASLRDSSRTWRTFVRPAALDTCIEIDSTTAGTYVLSINVDCIRDSALLSPMLDKMYARSGGGGSIFPDTVRVKVLSTICDTCSFVEVRIPNRASGFATFRLSAKKNPNYSFRAFSLDGTGGGGYVGEAYALNSYYETFGHAWGKFTITSQAGHAKIGTHGTSGAYGDFAIHTNASNGNLSTNERMRFTAAGPVGIGLSSPKSALQIVGGLRSDSVITPVVDNGTNLVQVNKLRTDTTVMRFVTLDSAGYRLVDSGYIRPVTHQLPWGNSTGHKSGRVLYEMKHFNCYNRLTHFNFVCDSGQGVILRRINIRGSGSYRSAGDFRHQFDSEWRVVFYQQFPNVAFAAAAVVVDGWATDGTAIYTRATGSASFCPLTLKTGNIKEMSWQVEIEYELPIANTSTSPVIVTEW